MSKSEIGQRVVLLRKKLEMTQEELGQALSMKKSGMSKIESGENTLTEKNQEILHQRFGVNKSWLVTGEGDMFIQSAAPDMATIAPVLRSLGNINPKDLQIIEAYLKLEDRHREAFRELFSKLFEG